jgi:ubiquinone/menaquinone biosynthesis C-methylase UbiE
MKSMKDNTRETRPVGAGASSFDLVDSKALFDALPLERGRVFLDMACGFGAYALAASHLVGEEGHVYAVDLWEEGIAALRQQVAQKSIKNVEALVADVSKRLPLAGGSVHVCLMATVLHDLVEIHAADGALREAARVLTRKGILAVVEFKKYDGRPGPPIHIKLSPEETDALVTPYGFKNVRYLDVGPYNYLLEFVPVESGEARATV